MLQLLRDRVQVRPVQVRDDVTSAGIIVRASKGIVDSQKQFGRQGHIVDIGPDVHDVRVGDQVLWGEFEFPRYEANGETFVILQEADITAVLEH